MRDTLVLLPNSVYSNLIVERLERLYPGKSKYLVLQSLPDGKNYITNPAIILFAYDGRKKRDLPAEVGIFKRIIVHLHDQTTAHFITRYNQHQPGVQYIWVLWGADLYYLPDFIKHTGNTFTQPFINQKLNHSFIDQCKQFARALLGWSNLNNQLRSYQLFDAIATIVRGDYENAKAYFRKNYRFVSYSHLSLSQMFKEEQTVDAPTGNAILLGNSGDPANNHNAIIEQLSVLKTNRKVICPLSYGIPAYIKVISQYGKEKLGELFTPVTTFMPPQEYYAMLQNCSVAIFNHTIQQAYGNIIGLLWNGTKVFLNEENTIFPHLKEAGVHIYSIQKDLSTEIINTSLHAVEIRHNKAILANMFSDHAVNNYYKSLMES